MKWFELMEDYFGVRLTQEKSERWMMLLQEEDALGENLKEQDLIDTLKWVRKQREGDQNRKPPTLETLIGWVKWWHKEKNAVRRGYLNDDRNLTGQIKNQMLQASSHAERWEIPCNSSLTYGDTVDVDHWAEHRWRDWTRERDKIKKEIGEAIGKWIKETFKSGITQELPYDKTEKVAEIDCPF